MYILIRAQNEYDEHVSSPVAVSSKRELLERRMRELKEQDSRWSRIRAAREKFEKQYEREHPRPQQEEVPVIPKWPAGLAEHQITPEMRAARHAAAEESIRVSQANHEAFMKWYAAMQAASGQYVTNTLGASPKDLEETRSCHIHFEYYIEEIEEIS